MDEVAPTAVRHRHHGKVLRAYGGHRRGFRRLMRRGGVKRITEHSYGEANTSLGLFLRSVLSHAVALSEYRKAKTVAYRDVASALSTLGLPMYGDASYETHRKKHAVPVTAAAADPLPA